MIPSATLQAALEYAARQWRVVPLHYPTGLPAAPCSCARPDCDKPGKHPMIKAWPENASTEPSVIKRWWAQWPKANVGIVCGKESGIFAVDVDGYEGLTELHRLDALHGSDDSPITPRSKTGGGGTHILFQHEPGLKNEVRFAPGLDIRTDGGLIVAPPSIHQSGTLYEWDALADPSEVPVAECPRWLLQIIRASAIKSTAAVVRDAEVIPQGTRDRTLTSLAGSMRRVGMTEPE